MTAQFAHAYDIECYLCQSRSMRILFHLAYTCVLAGLLLYDMLGLEVCDRARWIMLLATKLLVKLMSMWAIEEPVIIILFMYLGSTVIDELIAYRWGGTCGTCKAALFFEVFSLSGVTGWCNSEVYWYGIVLCTSPWAWWFACGTRHQIALGWYGKWLWLTAWFSYHWQHMKVWDETLVDKSFSIGIRVLCAAVVIRSYHYKHLSYVVYHVIAPEVAGVGYYNLFGLIHSINVGFWSYERFQKWKRGPMAYGLDWIAKFKLQCIVGPIWDRVTWDHPRVYAWRGY